MNNENKKLPKEFYQFLNFFAEFPVQFYNPKIYIKKQSYLESTSIQYGDEKECEIQIEYISAIQYETLKEDCIDNLEEIARSVNFLKKIGEDPRDIDRFIEESIEEREWAKKLYARKVPCDFKGYVATKDLSISLTDNLVQASITSIGGKVIILYGELDENKRLNNITVSLYEVFDFCKDFSGEVDELAINCNTLKSHSEQLEDIGVFPEEKFSLDFNQFLDESGLASMKESPLGAIYQAKQLLINIVIERNNEKTK